MEWSFRGLCCSGSESYGIVPLEVSAVSGSESYGMVPIEVSAQQPEEQTEAPAQSPEQKVIEESDSVPVDEGGTEVADTGVQAWRSKCLKSCERNIILHGIKGYRFFPSPVGR
jgi:hypothetical protein